MIAALASEEGAAKFFESLGFIVEKGFGRGPDLFCRLGPWEYLVEVKLVGYNAKRWRTGAVTKRCEYCDLVAMVLPNGRVYIDDMKTHLKNCAKSDKTRTVTKIVREFGINPLPPS